MDDNIELMSIRMNHWAERKSRSGVWHVSPNTLNQEKGDEPCGTMCGDVARS
jgi:hypothetical protein